MVMNSARYRGRAHVWRRITGVPLNRGGQVAATPATTRGSSEGRGDEGIPGVTRGQQAIHGINYCNTRISICNTGITVTTRELPLVT